MESFTREYLELLAEKYPNSAAACSELVNTKAILSLPKGTEHFISDLHGEYGAVRHILNNCSGVILEKVRRLFEEEIGEERCRSFCSLIYYPAEELNALREKGEVPPQELIMMLERLVRLAELLSGKYTRGYVRKQITPQWSFVLDELLHIQRDEDANQLRYHEVLLNSIVESGAADSVIIALCDLIKSLAVDRLHVVGDIYDRGPEPARLIDSLMQVPNIDIQWGNHDILWMGAASGSPACIFTVIRIASKYDYTALLERRYGIPMLPLLRFCEKVYGGADKKHVQSALSILGMKLEGQIIKRHPGYCMDDRLMLEKIDYVNYTVELETGSYPLNTHEWPTVDPAEPYKLSADEEKLVEDYVYAFRDSRALAEHIDFIYKNGSTYLCCNGNLIFHGCIPMTEDGEFASVRHGGKRYKGKSLLDYADKIVKCAWAKKDESALDMMWYLWCGNDSPFSGRIFHTFERAVVDDKETWREPKNPYFAFWNSEETARKILSEFGLSEDTGHIINGHTPVKTVKGESPVKANGKLFIIDGGFCAAYQKTTGIAGYTLIYNSHGLKLKAHRPFEGIAKVLSENADIESDSVQIERFPTRRTIADTDNGERLRYRIEALNALISAYLEGEIAEKSL